MDFLIALFGGLWLLWKWLGEESRGDALNRMMARADREKKALNPDSGTYCRAVRFADDHKNIVLMRYRDKLEQIFGEDRVLRALNSDLGYASVDRDVVIAFMLAEKGFYKPYLNVSLHSNKMDGKNIITYYHILEDMLHEAGKTDVKFYLSIYRNIDGTYRDFRGEARYGDEFILEQETRLNVKCVRLWD